MHFLMPDRFALTNDFDLQDADQEAKIKDLHKKLEGMMIRRLKRDVMSDLPSKSERILRVEMSAMQTHYYKNILTKVGFSTPFFLGWGRRRLIKLVRRTLRCLVRLRVVRIRTSACSI
jgi:SNF2 family DNA or RNA helicase